MSEDKGKAPSLRAPKEAPDYGVIGQPKDSIGEPIRSTHYSFNRKEGGDVNVVEGIPKVNKSGDVD